ncbi:MAG TPA: glycine cleavage system protein GcvH [Anaerolineae bacterium]|nr:glycine cleavage system protein GcvH [Anaerolineae bacterium]HQI86521.1 glycine cleavage system protein GcvH [Anaerolineae bacterium]
MNIDTGVRYLETHEWARREGNEIVIGITDYAQSTLSDIVYVELPEVGDTLAKGDQFGVVESVKAAADVYLPMGGKVVAVNTALEDTPELVNEDAFGAGWMVRLSPTNVGEWEELLDAEAYQKVVEEEEAAH